MIRFCDATEFPRESESKISQAYRSHQAARSISISRQMSNRSVTCIHIGCVRCVHTRTQIRTHAYVIHSVTISRKSIIKPLSCRGYNGRGELFWSGCIVLAGSPVGLELSAEHMAIYAATYVHVECVAVCAYDAHNWDGCRLIRGQVSFARPTYWQLIVNTQVVGSVSTWF